MASWVFCGCAPIEKTHEEHLKNCKVLGALAEKIARNLESLGAGEETRSEQPVIGTEKETLYEHFGDKFYRLSSIVINSWSNTMYGPNVADKELLLEPGDRIVLVKSTKTKEDVRTGGEYDADNS
jgi:hypothetical protein